jgi:hypothetical protein
MTEKVRILYLTANPVQSARLRTDEDYRNISEAIRTAVEGSRFELVPLLAVRRTDLQRALRQHLPQIVHFSGHANEEGVIMEDDAGRSTSVTGEALAGLFQILSGKLRLVILSACKSQATADAFRQFVDYTIAMQRSITDRAAIVFNKELYGALADGAAIPVAFDYAVNALRFEHREEANIPHLVRRPGVSNGLPLAQQEKAKRKPRRRSRSGVNVQLVNGNVHGSINTQNGDNNTILEVDSDGLRKMP